MRYVIKCKLPSPRTDLEPGEYDTDYNDAIFKEKPQGFEVAWTERNSWPTDNDGFTWVTLWYDDKVGAIEWWREQYFLQAHELENLRKKIKDLGD